MKLELHMHTAGNRSNEPRSAALEGIMAGLSLECTYDPERLSERQAAEFLGHIFDSILPTGSVRDRQPGDDGA